MFETLAPYGTTLTQGDRFLRQTAAGLDEEHVELIEFQVAARGPGDPAVVVGVFDDGGEFARV